MNNRIGILGSRYPKYTKTTKSERNFKPINDGMFNKSKLTDELTYSFEERQAVYWSKDLFAMKIDSIILQEDVKLQMSELISLTYEINSNEYKDKVQKLQCFLSSLEFSLICCHFYILLSLNMPVEPIFIVSQYLRDPSISEEKINNFKSNAPEINDVDIEKVTQIYIQQFTKVLISTTLIKSLGLESKKLKNIFNDIFSLLSKRELNISSIRIILCKPLLFESINKMLAINNNSSTAASGLAIFLVQILKVYLGKAIVSWIVRDGKEIGNDCKNRANSEMEIIELRQLSKYMEASKYNINCQEFQCNQIIDRKTFIMETSKYNYYAKVTAIFLILSMCCCMVTDFKSEWINYIYCFSLLLIFACMRLIHTTGSAIKDVNSNKYKDDFNFSDVEYLDFKDIADMMRSNIILPKIKVEVIPLRSSILKQPAKEITDIYIKEDDYRPTVTNHFKGKRYDTSDKHTYKYNTEKLEGKVPEEKIYCVIKAKTFINKYPAADIQSNDKNLIIVEVNNIERYLAYWDISLDDNDKYSIQLQNLKNAFYAGQARAAIGYNGIKILKPFIQIGNNIFTHEIKSRTCSTRVLGRQVKVLLDDNEERFIVIFHYLDKRGRSTNH